MRARLGRLRADEAGAILPLVALVLAMLCGFAGLGVDLGLVYLEKRRIQSAVDLAALAAARASDGAAAATRALVDNGYRIPDDVTVVPGTYVADRTIPPARRFTPGSSAPNAVRIHLANTVRTAFTRIVGGPASFVVSGDATARRAELASFGIGSRLVGLDAGIANALLSRLLGTTVSLSLMDYRALAGLRVDALGFLRGAAPRLGLQAVTFDDVLAGSLRLSDFVALLGQAADPAGGSGARPALNALTAALSGTGTSVRLAGLLNAGEIGSTPVAQTGEALWVNALDMMGGAAFLASGGRQVGLDLGTAIPGLLRATVSLRTGDAWRTSGFTGIGGSLSTAQQRILVELSIPGPVGLVDLSLPIMIELAPARAVLRSVVCPWNASGERTATLDVSTGIAALSIGAVPANALDLGSPRGAPVPATILRAPLLSVTGVSSVQLGASTRSLTFTDDDIRAGRVRTVSTTTLVSSATASLLANLDLQVNGLSLPGIIDPKGLVTGILGAAAGPIDSLLFSILGLAGVKLGAADVAVTGTRCGGAVLVQ